MISSFRAAVRLRYVGRLSRKTVLPHERCSLHLAIYIYVRGVTSGWRKDYWCTFLQTISSQDAQPDMPHHFRALRPIHAQGLTCVQHHEHQPRVRPVVDIQGRPAISTPSILTGLLLSG